MNREIKFRAWDKEAKRLFNLTDSHDTLVFFQSGASYYNLQNGSGGAEYELMQFTGLLDKNGKPIYEGDVLAERGNLHRTGVVRYEPNIAAFMVFVDGGYCHLNEGDWCKGDQLQYTEVIGNIYQDSHLLTIQN
jgi:uncharacterized phage protein (TIGR01671 family)